VELKIVYCLNTTSLPGDESRLLLVRRSSITSESFRLSFNPSADIPKVLKFRLHLHHQSTKDHNHRNKRRYLNLNERQRHSCTSNLPEQRVVALTVDTFPWLSNSFNNPFTGTALFCSEALQSPAMKMRTEIQEPQGRSWLVSSSRETRPSFWLRSLRICSAKGKHRMWGI